MWCVSPPHRIRQNRGPVSTQLRREPASQRCPLPRRHRPNVLAPTHHCVRGTTHGGALGTRLKRTSSMVPIERALLRTLPWLVGGLVLSIPLLLVNVGGAPLGKFTVHLTALVGFGLVLTNVLVRFGTAEWFSGLSWSVSVRLIASGIGLVVLVTGAVGLVTLASSAALRYDPSTQFLQLISALDIAWVVAAITIGAYRAWGRGWAVFGGVAVGLVCIWSIWNYLDHVGFGPNGEWIVSAPDLMRLVLPYDTVAAVVAVTVFLVGARRAAQATEQPSPQS